MGVDSVRFSALRISEIPNYRQHTKEQIEELAASIKVRGLLQPMLVKECKEDGKTYYDVIDGEGRYRAIAKIRESEPRSLDYVHVLLFRGNSEDVAFARFSANQVRDGHSPIEAADFLISMRNRKLPIKDIAQKAGVTESHIYSLLSVREKCHPDVLDALREGRISFNSALKLSKLPEKKQPDQLKNYLETREKQGTKAASRSITANKRPPAKELKAFHRLSSLMSEAGAYQIEVPERLRQRWVAIRDILDWLLGKSDRPALEEDEEELIQKITERKKEKEEEER